MTMPLVIPIQPGLSPDLVGGKAAGLSRLAGEHFPIPPGYCMTATAYRSVLSETRIVSDPTWQHLGSLPEPERARHMAEMATRVAAVQLPPTLRGQITRALDQIEATLKHSTLWAVRSSATHEDAAGASCAGLFRTELGVRREDVPGAITACWASLWTAAALAYWTRTASSPAAPSMAVILQPLLNASAAGVAYSRHPVTGRADQIVLNAVFGLGEPLVSGRVAPDSYTIQLAHVGDPGTIVERSIARKTHAQQWDGAGPRTVALPVERQTQPALSDDQALTIAAQVRQIETIYGQPVDVEWAFEADKLWLLQARPIVVQTPSPQFQDAACTWSRANFKETLPDVPSPLGLSFLQEFMEHHILRHYREIGCVIPDGVTAVRLIHGRPFINVTLFQSLVQQVGADPASVTEQMGGQGILPQTGPPVLPWWTRLRAGWLMDRKIRGGLKIAPAWFQHMRDLRTQLSGDTMATCSSVELLARMDHLGEELRAKDLTFAIVAGVAQGLEVMRWMLPSRLGTDWRSLLNRSLQGLGTVISAKQILWFTELAEMARKDPRVQAWLHTDTWNQSDVRVMLQGSHFLSEFDRYLSEYGHRAIGESDLMTPRFAETPAYALGIIRRLALDPPLISTVDAKQRQETERAEALGTIRRQFSWPVWSAFTWWHRRLTRALALREGNRHALMHVTTALRHLALQLGAILVAKQVLTHADEVFFFTAEEMRQASTSPSPRWKDLIASRQAARTRHLSLSVSDTVAGLGPSSLPSSGDDPSMLQGIPISAGRVEGPIHLIRVPNDLSTAQRGDILVVSVIDPGMAPIFAIAGGLIAEMGGTLSHGAIIAREYGLPAVVNVSGAMMQLQEGTHVELDASAGTITILAHLVDSDPPAA